MFAVEKSNFNIIFGWNHETMAILWQFLQKKWIFLKISPKIGSFSKNAIKWKVMTQMFCNFFYKIWTECRYEKCPRTWFLVKNWSKFDYVKHAEIKKTPCMWSFSGNILAPKCTNLKCKYKNAACETFSKKAKHKMLVKLIPRMLCGI